jgi:hypothetical protein
VQSQYSLAAEARRYLDVFAELSEHRP